MRTEELVRLLAEERGKRSRAPSSIVSKNNLSFLSYLGIKDEDIIKYVIPQIVDMELAGEYSKEKIKLFITHHEAIELLPLPERHSLDKSVALRRMDSLSRLLALETKYTPCVSVTFYNGELVISSNAPNLDIISAELLTDHLVKKMALIQEFIRQLLDGVELGSNPEVTKITFSAQAQLLAAATIAQITDPKNGGIGDVLPSTPSARRRKTASLHLENALLKLGQHCLLSVLTNGKQGFTLLELNALLADRATIVLPNVEVLGKKQLHAEQAILYYLREYTDFDSEEDTVIAHIGISKLCCQACHDVLNKEERIGIRGTHGMSFPNVYDIDSDDLHASRLTRMGADLCPSDSESECSFVDEDDDEEIPSFASLLEEAEEVAARHIIKASGGQMLFKASCRQEAADVLTEESKLIPPVV